MRKIGDWFCIVYASEFKAEMTSVGFGDVINPLDGFDVAHGYKVTGGAYFTQTDEAYPLVNITDGCSVSYRYLDFSEKDEWKIILTGTFLADGEVKVCVNEKEVVCMAFTKESRELTGLLNFAAYSEMNKQKTDLRLEFRGAASVQLLELEKICFS